MIAAMTTILFLTESSFRMIRDYIIFDRIDIHCEVPGVPFKDLS